MLNGSLELMSRQIISGSVRLLFAVVYALFLGFGFTIGAELYELITSRGVYGADDYTCSLAHDPSGPWYRRTPSIWWGEHSTSFLRFLNWRWVAFLTVPMYSLFLSLRNQAPWNRKEMVRKLLRGVSVVLWRVSNLVFAHSLFVCGMGYKLFHR